MARSNLKAILATRVSATPVADIDVVTLCKFLTQAEALDFDCKFLQHVETVLTDLSGFLLVEGTEQGNFGIDTLLQDLDLGLDAIAARGADAVATVVCQRRDHTRVLFQSANAARRRRSSRIILAPKDPLSVSVTRRRSSKTHAGAALASSCLQAQALQVCMTWYCQNDESNA